MLFKACQRPYSLVSQPALRNPHVLNLASRLEYDLPQHGFHLGYGQAMPG